MWIQGFLQFLGSGVLDLNSRNHIQASFPENIQVCSLYCTLFWQYLPRICIFSRRRHAKQYEIIFEVLHLSPMLAVHSTRSQLLAPYRCSIYLTFPFMIWNEVPHGGLCYSTVYKEDGRWWSTLCSSPANWFVVHAHIAPREPYPMVFKACSVTFLKSARRVCSSICPEWWLLKVWAGISS